MQMNNHLIFFDTAVSNINSTTLELTKQDDDADE